MKNNGLFSTLFLSSLKEQVTLTDLAQGRMASLTQTWINRDLSNAESLWETFMKQALSYLQFVPSGTPSTETIYPLYEDYSFTNPIAALCLANPGADMDATAIGRFLPGKLIGELKRCKLNWGILSNGACWRLYSIKSSKPYEDFVELDLSEALKQNDEKEYDLFERFFHRDSFVPERSQETGQTGEGNEALTQGVYTCRLDRDRKSSEKILEEQVKTPLLRQVDEVLQYLCNGFIADTPRKGDEYTEEERSEIFESAVKLLYRCLFLFYAEARRLLPSDPEKREIYEKHSIKSLCREAWDIKWGKRGDLDDFGLWKHLKGLISAVNDGDPEYGIMGYNGGLFDDEEEKFLGKHQLRNDFLSRALYLLAYVEPAGDDKEAEYAIPYEDLEVRHLGEMYENILEWNVTLADADRIRRRTKKGVETHLATETTFQKGDQRIKKGDVYFAETALERKQTGSYYTPEALVHFLNQKAIIQPLVQRFDQDYRPRFEEFIKQAQAGMDSSIRQGALQSAIALIERFVQEVILPFKVCDPAMGSGHFLVNGSNQITDLIVELLSKIPAREVPRLRLTCQPNIWRRLVTRHCLYGVDLNPLAVHLAKLSLWLNCFAQDHKLTFLDHHLKCGNSLIGIRSIHQLKSIPEKKKFKKKGSQLDLKFPENLAGSYDQAVNDFQSILAVEEDDTDRQKDIFEKASGEILSRLSPLADLYTAFLINDEISQEDYQGLFRRLAENQAMIKDYEKEIFKRIMVLKIRHSFFHWGLEFPEVFAQKQEGGFDATVGNPPWDILKPNSQEFFSAYAPDFRKYDKQKAGQVSAHLMKEHPSIQKKWNEYIQEFEEQSEYVREHSAYQFLGKGDINTYKLFLERFFGLLKSGGRLGIVTPSGLYTDQGCQPLREMFFSQSHINCLYCFENRWPTVFNAVDGRFKFILFCTEKGGQTDFFRCAFMKHDPERLPVIESNALRMSVEKIKKLSPDSLAVMELNSQRDVEIMTSIYGDLPLLGEKVEEGWNVKLRMGDYHLTNDSYRFNRIETLLESIPTSAEELISKLLEYNHYPVYEGKNCWFFDSNVSLPTLCVENKHTHGIAFKLPRVGFRRIAASTNERTLIPCIIPGKSLCTYGIIFADDNADVPLSLMERIIYAAFIGSFSLDFILRFQISTSISNSNGYSLPIPRSYAGTKKFDELIARVCRLISTTGEFSDLWNSVFDSKWQSPIFWYPSSAPIDTYGPIHEQEIRLRLRDEAKDLTADWGPHCGVHDRTSDRRDTGDRAQLRAEIDAYVAHLYGLSRDDFAYILDTFPVLKRKEEQAFGEFMSKRKCLEEYDRIAKIL